MVMMMILIMMIIMIMIMMQCSQFHQPTCCFSSEAGNLSRCNGDGFLVPIQGNTTCWASSQADLIQNYFLIFGICNKCRRLSLLRQKKTFFLRQERERKRKCEEGREEGERERGGGIRGKDREGVSLSSFSRKPLASLKQDVLPWTSKLSFHLSVKFLEDDDGNLCWSEGI